MKKFSQITGKEFNTIDITNSLTDDITELVESSLNVLVKGNLDEFLTENITIDGKKILIERIVDYIEEINLSNNSILLEKVRYQGIESVEKELLTEGNTPSEIRKNRFRVENLLDKNDVSLHAQRQADRITNGEKAYYRGLAAEYMIEDRPERKKDLRKIADIFNFRAKQLGFTK